jgi:hypothetical protein
MSLILGILDSGGVAASTSSYESIASATGTGSSGTILFSSIPSTYKHLQIRSLANDNSGNQLSMQFNSDTGSNYSYHRLQGAGVSAAATGAASQTEIPFIGYAAGTTSIYGVGIIDIHDYASTSKYKTSRSFIGYDINGGGLVLLGSGLWMSTSAISSISITSSGGNFTTASTFALYGIKG